ncbi:hypothetical protein SAMN05444161_1356 [Rhizobiales bacterium GAS191]|jgi:hypothetical protein|nr:hypothetical protein SAMN05519103_00468 [Rhizobiales bacterium GAS113]SEC55258.1 hypothetical protein SAMN05444161_1356 [Rhizobiales bacterium GAS191]SEC72046.1 hypothetical protein SAMN05519104_1947 [Rhizobiales bacterium GAS188]
MLKMLVIAFAMGLAASPVEAQSTASLCAGKGTVDATMPIPRSLMESASRLFGDDGTDFLGSTVFRCMNNEVWLCNYGANLVCDKADASRINPGAAQWCRENPGAAGVPMAATGHATIFSWSCAGRKAKITGAVAKVDPRGYLAGNWKRLPE